MTGLERDVAGREEADEAEKQERGRVIAERLSGIDDWEMYRLFDVKAQEPVCSVTLRHQAAAAAVEYAVWREREDGDEPGATGTIEWKAEGAAFGDDAREVVLRQIAHRYEEDLAVPQDELVFRLDGSAGDELGDDEADGEEDEEDEEDEDSEEEDD